MQLICIVRQQGGEVINKIITLLFVFLFCFRTDLCCINMRFEEHISGIFLHTLAELKPSRVNSRGLSSPVKRAWILTLRGEEKEVKVSERDIEKCFKNKRFRLRKDYDEKGKSPPSGKEGALHVCILLVQGRQMQHNHIL